MRLVCLGISLHVAALHLTLARRGHAANVWVAVWALATALIQVTQIIRSQSEDVLAAVGQARLAVATLPVLLGGLAFVVRTLAGRRVGRRSLAALASVAVPFGAAAIFTNAFLVGPPHPAPGPALPLIAVVLVIAFGAMAHEARGLERHDRSVLLATLGVYVSASVYAVVHASVLPSTPFAAGVGTGVAAIGLSHLVIGHERRLVRAQAVLGTQQLAVSESRLRELVERAPIGILTCDATGQVETVNPCLWKTLGAPERMRQARLGNIVEYEARIWPGRPSLVGRALAGETRTVDIDFAPAWGRARQLRCTATPLRDANGTISGALLLSEDVTERNELERRLHLAQKLEAVGQLAAGIAHEINTPMAYVRSNLRALHRDWSALGDEIRKDPASEATTDLLAGAEALIVESLEGVERTVSIARDMREFAHSASAGREPTDLNHEVETCVRLAATQHPRIPITESYGPLPRVTTSAGQLRQVFLNLIVNALQAVAEGGRVEVSTLLEGELACVRVRDDGPGIAPELQPRLFEPFFTTKPADQGTGLGLYISYQIVRAHGGEIRVDSRPGAGSTFEVRLPLASSSAAERRAQRAE